MNIYSGGFYIFKIIALIIGIALGLYSILFFSFIFFFITEYIFYILLAAILIIFVYEMLKEITNTIKNKDLEHRNKSFEKIVDEIYYICNNSNKFNSKIYKLRNEYYLTFYNDIFSETNKINSWDIIIDYSQSYNSKENTIFYININKLKNNKNIKQYYQDDLIAMNFGYNYKTNIPKFIDEKLEIVSKKHIIHTNNFYNYSANESNNKKENYNNVKTINKDKNYNNKYDKELKPVSVIFFDTETDGLSVNSSVLSISAAKCIVDYQNKKVKIIDRYERFYYPIENYNSEAISVNGLCQSIITEKRKGAKYRRHFKEDINSFFKFIDGIEHFVAHNIEFDRKFINKRLSRQFCTMKSNTNIMKLRMIRGKHKWPKLEEAVAFYKIRNTNTSRFHDSMYDVEMTVAVFEKMLYHSKTSNYIHDFLYKPDYSYINYDYYY